LPGLPHVTDFFVYHPFHSFFTGCPWLYIIGGEQSESAQGNNQNYVLEYHGDGFIDGNRSSCRAVTVLARALILRKNASSEQVNNPFQDKHKNITDWQGDDVINVASAGQ
jgi:hypothetical protein